MNLRWWLLTSILAGLATGCENRSTPPPVAPTATATATAPTTAVNTATAALTTTTVPPLTDVRPLHLLHAQPRLATTQLWLGAEELTVELAVSQTEVATGMMFREKMPEGEGMLFIFRAPHQTGFYMKNTLVPLSAAYISPEGRILEIVDLQPGDETPKHSQTDQVQYVLEVNQGWFKQKGIGPGTILRTARGTLQESFFGRR